MKFRARAWGMAVTIAVHAGGGAGLWAMGPLGIARQKEAVVEFDVVAQPAPITVLVPPVPASLPPPAPRTRTIAVPGRAPAPVPQESAPPPTIGVTEESVVEGESAIAVPIGDVRAAVQPHPENINSTAVSVLPGAVADSNAFSPVADAYIAEENQVLFRPSIEYPPEAMRAGLEGQVLLRVGIDRRGAVRLVTVIKGAGHGFDEAAVKALWQFRFTPARTADGAPVDRRITYKYTFRR